MKNLYHIEECLYCLSIYFDIDFDIYFDVYFDKGVMIFFITFLFLRPCLPWKRVNDELSNEDDEFSSEADELSNQDE